MFSLKRGSGNGPTIYDVPTNGQLTNRMTGQNHSFKSPICTWRRVLCFGGNLCLHTGSEYGVRSVL